MLSYEKNADVLWLRSLNPWSPQAGGAMTPTHGDIVERITALRERRVDAILHDPPRFGIAGELYSQAFYGQLASVLRRNGRMFHYTGAPNRRASGRDLRNEVMQRLRKGEFSAAPSGDGVLTVGS